MGGHTDIEEKFKKDVSKELANLKEFLISQGKEIVKIKQENKALRETGSGHSNGESTGRKSLRQDLGFKIAKVTVRVL